MMVTERGGKKALGVIINPVAGLGGRVGLKGSDGPDILEKALAMGARPEASKRAARALSQLENLKDTFDLYTYGKEMGENLLRQLGFTVEVVGSYTGLTTTAQDTIQAAKLLQAAGVDLLVFAGGDGTARNICEAIGSSVPVIGIPAGVKIHSAVYAINPRNAGLAIRDFLGRRNTGLKEAEVMDIDEELFRQNRINSKLYGYMMVPDSGSRIQNMKSGGASQAGDLVGMAGYIVCNMEKDTIYIIGPGSTTRSIMEDMGLPNTLLGVDVVKNRRLIASDVTEGQLWELIEDAALNVKIVVTVIGGQGSLFGRGNQQISPRIIKRVGRENIIVAATVSKLLALNGQPLLVDTGDQDLDHALCGFIEVVVAFGQTSYCRVES